MAQKTDTAARTHIDVDHRSLLRELVAELERDHLPWYRSASQSNYLSWTIASGLAFLCTIGSALAASLIGEEQFKTFGKYLLIILPIIAATASGFLHLYKFREKEALREEGLIEVEDIIRNAKSLLATDSGVPDFKLAYHQVRERLRSLELNQHRRDIALRSDEIPKPKL
jgi:hypothetical protein